MKLFISSIVLLLMSGFWYVSAGFNPYETSDVTGSITIIVIDETGEEIINQVHDFNEDDTLFKLLTEHYQVTTKSSMGGFQGTVILGIDSVQTDFESDFIRILIDGFLYDRSGNPVEMNRRLSTLGIDLIPLIDGNTYIFEYARVNKGGS